MTTRRNWIKSLKIQEKHYNGKIYNMRKQGGNEV